MAQLKAPAKPSLRFLQSWLDSEQEGASFLRGRERWTWDDSNLRDFVALLNPEEASGSITRWLNPRLVDWYHRVWGGRRRVKHKKKSQGGPFANKMLHTKAIDPENERVISYDDSKAVQGSQILSQLAITIITSILPALSILWLYNVQRTVVRIFITIGLAALLGIFLRFATNAKLKEIFGATAAYVTGCQSHIRLLTIFRFAAVEVVFIGSANGTSN